MIYLVLLFLSQALTYAQHHDHQKMKTVTFDLIKTDMI